MAAAFPYKQSPHQYSCFPVDDSTTTAPLPFFPNITTSAAAHQLSSSSDLPATNYYYNNNISINISNHISSAPPTHYNLPPPSSLNYGGSYYYCCNTSDSTKNNKVLGSYTSATTTTHDLLSISHHNMKNNISSNSKYAQSEEETIAMNKAKKHRPRKNTSRHPMITTDVGIANINNHKNKKKAATTADHDHEKNKKNKKKLLVPVEDVVQKEEDPSRYIHVRARRGQATDSHSLAERARREKISERMKVLQGLVPGCDKVTGKALVLDEIINYVQTLQNQVEFLSMKIACVNPVSHDFGMDLDAFMVKPDLQRMSSSLVAHEAAADGGDVQLMESRPIPTEDESTPTNIISTNVSITNPLPPNFPLRMVNSSSLFHQQMHPILHSHPQSGNGQVLCDADDSEGQMRQYNNYGISKSSGTTTSFINTNNNNLLLNLPSFH